VVAYKWKDQIPKGSGKASKILTQIRTVQWCFPTAWKLQQDWTRSGQGSSNKHHFRDCEKWTI